MPASNAPSTLGVSVPESPLPDNRSASDPEASFTGPLFIVGMPNALGLAILAAFMELLPSIGPAISGFVGFVVALFQGSNWLPVGNVFFAIIVALIYGVIGQLEGVYFIPRFVGGRVKLHPAVTFVGIIAGAMTFGVLGILLAAPVIASARVLRGLADPCRGRGRRGGRARKAAVRPRGRGVRAAPRSTRSPRASTPVEGRPHAEA